MWIFVLASAAVFFVIGIVAAALGSRLKHPIAIAANLLAIGAVFAFGSLMNVEPGRSSGNGNPAILLVIPLVGLGIVLIGQLYATPLLQRARPVMLGTLLIGLSAHQAAGFELQKLRYEARGEQVAAFFAAQGESGRTDADAVWPSVGSMKMNGHLFHGNTYLLLIGWAAIAAILLLLLRIAIRRRRNSRKAFDE